MPDDDCLNIRLSDYFQERREPEPGDDAGHVPREQADAASQDDEAARR
jgi:hypothetical protein